MDSTIHFSAPEKYAIRIVVKEWQMDATKDANGDCTDYVQFWTGGKPYVEDKTKLTEKLGIKSFNL